MFKGPVPVLDENNKPLMPCHPARARKLLRSGRAIKRFFGGVFCIKLIKKPASKNTQDVSVGIDPGSKWEGFTVKSGGKVLLNEMTDAVTWVKDAVETRRNMRRSRRFRKTPYRPCRRNRKSLRKTRRMPPSTRARWGVKLRRLNILKKMYPITHIVVEDIKAKTIKGKNNKWNKIFSPLQVGKEWFYKECEKLGKLSTLGGWETAELRKKHNLKKISEKKKEVFESHCVDSFVLASTIDNNFVPDNKNILRVIPLRFHRRQLHAMQPAIGGVRRKYGSTMSLDLKRGSLIKHPKHGLSFVGGTSKGRISLHSLKTGKRLTQLAKREDIEFLSYNYFRYYGCAFTGGGGG